MEENKKQRIYKTIMVIVLAVLLTFIGTTIFTYNKFKDSSNVKYVTISGSENSVGTEIAKVRSIIDKYYLGDIDEEKVKTEAIKGYVSGLGDKYTEYMTKEEWEEFSVDALGNYEGIGIYISKDEAGNIVIISPIKETPAYKAGLLPGDIITKVDGEDCSNNELTAVTNKVKGKEGTSVNIQVKRGEELLDFDIKREKVKIIHIESKVLENNIGYMELLTFDEGSKEEFKQKYEELKKQNIKGLIIDLRNNPGGIVSEALDIADLILPKDDTMLITKDKNGKEEVYKSKIDPIVKENVVVLVNENSASSSEILAGALKDNNRAKIVGTTTYGKGVIQDILQLTDGSALKITTNENYTPNNTKIHGVGISPDVEVELADEYKNSLNVEYENDTQLKKAVELLK